MDQPSYEQIELINKRLASLQQEVMVMEEEYGFSKDFTMEVTKPHTTKPTPTRYHKLPQVKEVPSSEKVRPNPKISQTWKEIFNDKPSLEMFYDESRFMPVNTKLEYRDQFEIQLNQDNFGRYFSNISGIV